MDRTSARVAARVDPALGYDLVLSMSVAAVGERTPVARALIEAAPGVAERLRRFASSDWMWAHLVPLVAEAPAPRDDAAFLAFLEAVPAREIQRRLIGYYVRWFRRLTPPDVMDAAIVGRAAAARELLRTSQPHDRLWQESLRARLDAGPARTKAELTSLASEWRDRAFVSIVGRARRTQRAAASAQRASLRRRGPSETVSGLVGWDYVPEPGVTRIVIVPSAVLGSVHEFEEAQTKFVCVPITPVETPPLPASLERLQILADGSRLRIVRALADEEHSAQELADRTGLALTTVLHHLAVLSEARLVEGGGRRRAYRLGRASLGRIADEIRALGRPAGAR